MEDIQGLSAIAEDPISDPHALVQVYAKLGTCNEGVLLLQVGLRAGALVGGLREGGGHPGPSRHCQEICIRSACSGANMLQARILQ